MKYIEEQMQRIKSLAVVKALNKPSRKTRKISLGILFIIILLGYATYGLQFSGPVILSDEVGYLTKAAFFSGNTVDASSSYHAGYPLLLAPFFFIFSNPAIIWKFIIILNAALFAGSSIILFKLLERIFIKQSFIRLLVVSAISFMLPGMIAISSFSMSSSAFIFLYLCLSYLLMVTNILRTKSVIFAALVTGLLYWLHPMGLVPILAANIIVLARSLKQKSYMSFILFAIVSTALVVTYKLLIHSWISNSMVPDGYGVEDHYSTVTSGLNALLEPLFWKNILVMMMGQVSYLLIATLGIVLFGFPNIVKNIGKYLSKRKSLTNEEYVAYFWAFSLTGMIIAGSIMLNLYLRDDLLAVNHWIYGRYTEMVLVPALACGLLAVWDKKRTLYAVAFVLFSGLLVQAYVDSGNTRDYIAFINIPSFWPYALQAHINFVIWFSIGALVISIVAILGKKLTLIAAVPLVMVSLGTHNSWHFELLNSYSKPSGMVDLIKDKFDDSVCIGLQPSFSYNSYERQRFWLYSYYLYRYDLQRMTPEAWRASECELYLTYEVDDFENQEDSKIVGRDDAAGMHLVVRGDAMSKFNDSLMSYENGFYLDTTPEGEQCFYTGCFSRNADQLEQFIIVGKLENSRIYTSGNEGYLFFGPYVNLKSGTYELEMEGDFKNLEGAAIEISGGEDDELLNRQALGGSQGSEIKIPFKLKDDTSLLQIRLFVGPQTDLSFDNYSVSVP